MNVSSISYECLQFCFYIFYRELTSKPHIAGREQDDEVLVKLIEESWKSNEFDSVRVYPYEVLLSYPEQNNSNYIAVVDQNGVESDVSQRKEFVIDEEQNDPNVVDPFNAYSTSGEPEVGRGHINAVLIAFIKISTFLKIFYYRQILRQFYFANFFEIFSTIKILRYRLNVY